MVTCERHEVMPLGDRQRVYNACGLPEGSIRRIEEMIRASGERQVGKGALDNVTTIFASQKNKASRTTESHTVEQLFAYECELDPNVLMYHCQIPCPGVARTTKSGRRHISAPTLDFLTFKKDCITLIECKATSWLRKQAKLPESPWTEDRGRWHNAPLEAYCADLGIDLHIYAAPEPPAIYKQNLELCVASLRSSLSDDDLKVMSRVAARLNKGGASLEKLREDVPGFNARIAVAMLARRQAYAPLKSHSIDDGAQFVMYPDQERAHRVDAHDLEALVGKLDQPSGLSPLRTASRACMARATRRAGAVTSIALGEVNGSTKMRRLTDKVLKTVEAGKDLLEACLPNYAMCGNRTSRLTNGQRELLEFLVDDVWNKGLAGTPKEVYLMMAPEADRRGVAPVGRTTLIKMIRAAGRTQNALHRRGMRGYQAERDRGDPAFKTLPPLAYGHTVHVDSSRFDARIAPDIVRRLPAKYGTFYVAIDAQNGECLAYAFIFGPARTDGLALLIRDLVRRHGCLPHVLHIDRGSENLSNWAKGFFEGITSLRISPTAGSKYNGIAENLIKQVNRQVADKIPGNTVNDKQGRAADGRLKSLKQMKLDFLSIIELIESYLFLDRQETCRPTGMTPKEHKDEALDAYGHIGIPVQYDDDFVYRTSVPITVGKSEILSEGIRLSEGMYSCPELLVALRARRVQEIRIDPATAAYIFVRIDDRILKAFRSDCIKLLSVSDEQAMFTRFAQSCLAVVARSQNGAVDAKRHDRLTLAKMAARHDDDTSTPKGDVLTAPASSPESTEYTPLDWESIEAIEDDIV